jgi:hypothetical protein
VNPATVEDQSPLGASRGRLTWWPWAAAAVFWVVLPVLCLVGLGLGIDRLAVRLDDTPAGAKGTFVVSSRNCQQLLCITTGTFTSDNGQLVARNLLGDYRWTFDTDYRVVYDGSAADVIPLPAVWDPTSTVVGMAAALGLLGIWGYSGRRWLRSGGPSRLRAAGVGHGGSPPPVE